MTQPASNIRGTRAPTPHEILEARRTLHVKAVELAALRHTATGWRNAGVISAGFALAGGITGGPEVLGNLNGYARSVVLALLAVGVIAGFVAIAFAVRSSIGWPMETRTSGPLSLVTWEQHEALIVQRLVRWSMILAGIATASLVVALGISLVAPPREHVLVMTATNGAYCSSDVKVDATSVRIVVGSTGITVPRRDVVSISSVELCS